MSDASRPRLLLHTCCAVCSTVALERLTEQYQVTLFFYNPNIHPESEYQRRLEETRRYAAARGIPVVEGRYEPGSFAEAIRGLESLGERSDRCRACFRLRLDATAARADADGHDGFASTLTTSRFKRSADVHAAGRAAAARSRASYLEIDLKKRGGEQRSQELAREYDLYRQDYCGCEHSKRERESRLRRSGRLPD